MVLRSGKLSLSLRRKEAALLALSGTTDVQGTPKVPSWSERPLDKTLIFLSCVAVVLLGLLVRAIPIQLVNSIMGMNELMILHYTSTTGMCVITGPFLGNKQKTGFEIDYFYGPRITFVCRLGDHQPRRQPLFASCEATPLVYAG